MIRVFLHETHILRRIGKERRCCPPDFYDSPDADKQLAEKTSTISLADQATWPVASNAPPSVHPCVSTDINWKELLKLAPYWSHGEYDFNKLYQAATSFPWMDLRDRIELEHISSQERTQDYYRQYLDRGKEAEQEQALHRRSRVAPHRNGVKGRWVYHTLPYANCYEQCPFDGMHCLSNIAELILDILGGKKSNTAADRTLAIAQCVHPEWTKAELLPWVLARDDIARLEARLSAVIVPSGLSNEYKVQHVFSEQFGLTSHQRTMWLVVYWKFASDQLKLPSAYRCVISQLADDICSLMSPAFDRDDLHAIFDNVTETIAVFEGMFPESAMTFCLHELIDLAATLGVQGPLRSRWMYPYERAMRVVRRLTPDGGQSNDLTVASRLAVYEAAMQHEFSNDGDSCTEPCDDEESCEESWDDARTHEHDSARRRVWSEKELSLLVDSYLNTMSYYPTSDWQLIQQLIHEQCATSALSSWLWVLRWTPDKESTLSEKVAWMKETFPKLPFFTRCMVHGLPMRGNNCFDTVNADGLTRWLAHDNGWQSCWCRCRHPETGAEQCATICAFVRVGDLYFAVVQPWTLTLLGAEKGCSGPSYYAIDLSRSGADVGQNQSIIVVPVRCIYPTNVAVAALRAAPHDGVKPVRLANTMEDVNDVSYIAVIELQPWRSKCRALLRRIDHYHLEYLLELTWDELTRRMAARGFTISSAQLDHAMLNGAARADLSIAFKWNTGWAAGQLLSLAEDRLDRSRGLTHVVRFPDGIFPVRLDSQKQIFPETILPMFSYPVNSWCVWVSDGSS